MLQPGDRVLFQTALEPPEGFRLDYAIGTTFSLDLVALLTAPLAFTMFDRRSDDEERREESLELLESLRRYSSQIALFCQAGRISFPRARYSQFAWLERTVIECRVDRGLFHPKVWVLRYATAAGEVRYRMLCASRNLTLANSWDTLLSLEGASQEKIVGGAQGGPLADFVSALPAFARDVPDATLSRIRQIADELRRVVFAPPNGFETVRFHPLGVPGHAEWPFPKSGARALVISPFLSTATLQRLGEGFRQASLVSTPEALAELSLATGCFDRFWTLDDDALAELPPGVEPGEAVTRDELVQLVGLHAKTYVFERDGQTEVWTGSANATDAAFSRNVEFLTQLTGGRHHGGIDALLEPSKDGTRLVDILKDAEKLVGLGRLDEIQKGLEARIETARGWIVALGLEARVSDRETGYSLSIHPTAAAASSLPQAVSVTCWPVMVGEGLAQRFSVGAESARFEGISLEGLSAFIAFRVTAREQQEERDARFVLNLPLHGAPADREDKLLRALIGDRSRLVRFLTLLLSDDGVPPENLFPVPPGNGQSALGASDQAASPTGMFELLVRTLATAPERLDEVAKLKQKLEASGEQDSLFPENFESIWRPIWEARGRLACRKA
ncbi:MAG: hypothetical protein H0T05_03150 [Acidobacteria bacterium]|nr:hypothetical protein [Acidobacteriota bacterium]